MHNLGDCYLNRVGVEFSPAKAYAWYKAAAEHGGAIGYEDIGTDSTCIKIKMRRGEAEFFKLQPDDVWVWRGMAYVWTSADWSNGVLTMTMQKVSQVTPQ